MITAHMHKHKDSKRYNRPIGVKEGTKLIGRYADVMNRKVHFISSEHVQSFLRMRNV